MENVGKLLSLQQRKREEIILVSESNYHTAKFFTEHLVAIKMKKAQILMNKSFYLVLSILDLDKSVMYKFWYDYMKSKYGENGNLCYMDSNSCLFM